MLQPPSWNDLLSSVQSPPSQLGLVPLLQKLHGCVSRVEQFAVRLYDMPGRRWVFFPHTSTPLSPFPSSLPTSLSFSPSSLLPLPPFLQRFSSSEIFQHPPNQGECNDMKSHMYRCLVCWFRSSVDRAPAPEYRVRVMAQILPEAQLENDCLGIYVLCYFFLVLCCLLSCVVLCCVVLLLSCVVLCCVVLLLSCAVLCYFFLVLCCVVLLLSWVSEACCLRILSLTHLSLWLLPSLPSLSSALWRDTRQLLRPSVIGRGALSELTPWRPYRRWRGTSLSEGSADLTR